MKTIFKVSLLFLFVSCLPQDKPTTCQIDAQFLMNDQKLVCIKKKESCNRCELMSLPDGKFDWACTEMGCPPEPNKPLIEKCLKSIPKVEFCEDPSKFAKN